MFNLKSWLAGFLLGLAGEPLPLPQKEAGDKTPIAYLYNDMQLYALPTDCMEECPYVVIDQSGVVAAYFFSKPPYVYESGGVQGYGFQSGEEVKIYQSTYTDGFWSKPKERSSFGRFAFQVKWTNFDLMYGEEVFCAATEPVPVDATPLPVAKLYGGVRLPVIEAFFLTDWSYLYEFIARLYDENNAPYYAFVASAKKPYHASDGIHFKDDVVDTKMSYCYSPYDSWSEQVAVTEWDSATEVIWTGSDILNEDGSVYLAKSEPVPVYD